MTNMSNQQENPNEFGRRVVELRTAKGWSSNKLAKESGIDQGLLSKIERGIRRPSNRVIAKLAPHLGVAPQHLRGLADRDRLGPEGIRMILDAIPMGDEHWTALELERDFLKQEYRQLQKEPQTEDVIVRCKEIEERLWEIADESGAIQHPADNLTLREQTEAAGIPILTPDEEKKLAWFKRFSPKQMELLMGLTPAQVDGLLLLMGESTSRRLRAPRNDQEGE